MIQSFGDRETEALWNRRRVARFEQVERKARIKLEQLNQAASLSELRVPPSNRLHALKGDRKGQHSVSVNMQYRICFTGTKDGPVDVELIDYH